MIEMTWIASLTTNVFRAALKCTSFLLFGLTNRRNFAKIGGLVSENFLVERHKVYLPPRQTPWTENLDQLLANLSTPRPFLLSLSSFSLLLCKHYSAAINTKVTAELLTTSASVELLHIEGLFWGKFNCYMI